MSVNKIILIGNVGKDPEVKQINDSLKVAKFSLATSETYKNKKGEKVTNTEWHNVTAYNQLAGIVENYVKKGSKLFVEGKIQYKTYEKDGEKKYYTEINCRNIVMLDSKPEKKEDNFNDVPDLNSDTDTLPF